jgi:hypothetical protein
MAEEFNENENKRKNRPKNVLRKLSSAAMWSRARRSIPGS